MSDFAGKSVLVTGAGIGIGFALCRAFAEAGAWVGLNDRDASVAKDAASRINQAIGADHVQPCPADVSDVVAIRNLIDTFAATHDRLDIVVANAGITNYGPFLDYTPEAFDRLTGVNLRGTYFTAQAAARAMVARRIPGRIVLITSVTGVAAYTNLSAYGVTKAGIIHMARALAVELGPYAITVNSVCPGATVTERTLRDDPNYESNWQSVIPTGQACHVEDITAAVLFAASPAARQITGQNLIVDGGWTLISPIPDDHPDLPEFSAQLR